MPVQSIGGLESKKFIKRTPSNPVHLVLASYTSLLSSWSLSDILSWLITLGSHSQEQLPANSFDVNQSFPKACTSSQSRRAHSKNVCGTCLRPKERQRFRNSGSGGEGLDLAAAAAAATPKWFLSQNIDAVVKIQRSFSFAREPE